MAVSDDGRIYLCGTAISSSIVWSPGVTTNRTNRLSGYFGYLVSIDSTTGVAQWAHTYDTNSTDQCTGVAIDSIGNIGIAGQFGGGLSLKIGNKTLPSQGNTDVFLASYTRTGILRWSNCLGGKDADRASAIVASGTNFLVSGTINYDLQSSQTLFYDFDKDIMGRQTTLTPYDNTGQLMFLWSLNGTYDTDPTSNDRITRDGASNGFAIYGGAGSPTSAPALHVDPWGRVLFGGTMKWNNGITNIPGTMSYEFDAQDGKNGEAYLSRVYIDRLDSRFPLAFPGVGV
jgi:hypothetical protein